MNREAYETSPNGACETCRICGARTFKDDPSPSFHHKKGCEIGQLESQIEELKDIYGPVFSAALRWSNGEDRACESLSYAICRACAALGINHQPR